MNAGIGMQKQKAMAGMVGLLIKLGPNLRRALAA